MRVVRRSDYDPSIGLFLTENEGGDVGLMIKADDELGSYIVEFTQSGSQSPKTRQAVKSLIKAIQEEAKQHDK